MSLTPPNKSPEPTAVSAVSSAIAVHVVSRHQAFMTTQTYPAAQKSGWMLVACALIATVIIWPIAAGFYYPTAIGFVGLPGVILYLLLAVLCATCFVLCPRRQLVPKIITLIFTVDGLYWALDACAYYWLHVLYQS